MLGSMRGLVGHIHAWPLLAVSAMRPSGCSPQGFAQAEVRPGYTSALLDSNLSNHSMHHHSMHDIQHHRCSTTTVFAIILSSWSSRCDDTPQKTPLLQLEKGTMPCLAASHLKVRLYTCREEIGHSLPSELTSADKGKAQATSALFILYSWYVALQTLFTHTHLYES